MTLKQQIYELVEELPDDCPLLVEVRETLRMNHAIGEAMEYVHEWRTYSAEEFMAKVQERWPRKKNISDADGIVLRAKRIVGRLILSGPYTIRQGDVDAIFDELA